MPPEISVPVGANTSTDPTHTICPSQREPRAERRTSAAVGSHNPTHQLQRRFEPRAIRQLHPSVWRTRAGNPRTLAIGPEPPRQTAFTDRPSNLVHRSRESAFADANSLRRGKKVEYARERLESRSLATEKTPPWRGKKFPPEGGAFSPMTELSSGR